MDSRRTAEALRRIRRRMPIAIVRLDDLSEAVALCRALRAGGMNAIEITLTNSEACDAIARVRDATAGEDMVLGAGTVLTAADARNAIAAGAQFLVTPVIRRPVIDVGQEGDTPVICGAFTPTEIFDAWEAGADFVKVFPVRSLGPVYIRDVLAPLPGLRLAPTGGVHLENCAAFLDAGAYTVALGSNLVSPSVVARRDWAAITAVARQYIERCAPEPLADEG